VQGQPSRRLPARGCYWPGAAQQRWTDRAATPKPDGCSARRLELPLNSCRPGEQIKRRRTMERPRRALSRFGSETSPRSSMGVAFTIFAGEAKHIARNAPKLPPILHAAAFLTDTSLCLGQGFWRAWQSGDTATTPSTLLHEALHIYFGTTVSDRGEAAMRTAMSASPCGSKICPSTRPRKEIVPKAHVPRRALQKWRRSSKMNSSSEKEAAELELLYPSARHRLHGNLLRMRTVEKHGLTG